MNQISEKTIREIALAAPATTRVFEEFKIGYCCGGRRSIEDACAAAGIDAAVLEKRISDVIAARPDAADRNEPENKPPLELVEYIIDKHHTFTKSELARLAPLMEKVVNRHGELHPELAELASIFNALAESLIPHMMKEEHVLFPHIKRLGFAADNNMPAPFPPFGTVKNPIRMMMMEHDTDGERLAEMRRITNDYLLPDGACPSFTALYAGLQDLESDLHRHIHLENNVLFPAAAELEG
jgi:regulator of cell morphogenesis and NO signaling